MRRGIWPAFLALVFVASGLLGIWDISWLAFNAFKTLDLIWSQIIQEPLKPPAAPTWSPDVGQPATVGRHIRDIPLGRRDDILPNEGNEGIIALGIDNAGDYAPLIMQNDGAIRAAGKWHDGKTEKDHWIALRVDAQGRVIVSPESFWGLSLAPGETITIHAPTPNELKVKRR